MNISTVKMFSRDYDLSEDHDLQLMYDLIERSGKEATREIAKELSRHIRRAGKTQVSGHKIFRTTPASWLSHLILEQTDFAKIHEVAEQDSYDINALTIQIYVDGIEFRDEKFEVFMNWVTTRLEKQITDEHDQLNHLINNDPS